MTNAVTDNTAQTRAMQTEIGQLRNEIISIRAELNARPARRAGT